MEAEDGGAWCLIESDPGVFTELCERVGVEGVQFEEVYGVDEASFKQLKEHNDTIHGFIFLFRWGEGNATAANAVVDRDPPEALFFAKQVIENACATQALLCVLYNSPDVKLGPALSNLKEFTQQFDSYMKGLAISNCGPLREAHNSFKAMSSFEFVKEESTEKEAAFHFVSYVPCGNKLYELDGLAEGPIMLGEFEENKWVDTVRPLIQQRIERVQEQHRRDSSRRGGQPEIRFSLMAVVSDRLRSIEKKLLRQRITRQRAAVMLMSMGREVVEPEGEEDTLLEGDFEEPEGTPRLEDMPSDADALEGMIHTAELFIVQLKAELQDEKTKRKKWKEENARRRHDFVPFVLCALRHLARLAKLGPALKAAQERRRAEGGDSQGRGLEDISMR